MFKCPICGSREYKLKCNINSRLKKVPAGLTRPQKVNVKIIACTNCGLEANSKVINNFDFSNLYKQQSIYSKSETYKINDEYPTYTKDIIDLLRSFYKEGYIVLEIGSFTGNLLFKLRKMGIKCEGVELDPNAAAIAKKRKTDVYCGEVYDSHFDGKKYNIIIGIGILEHIQEPVKFLKRLKDLLEENGVIILQYPNRESLNALISRETKHSWDMYTEPGHVFFYNKKNVKELLDRCGLKLKKFYTATILSRGKTPIMPVRINFLEEKIRHITQRNNNIVFFIYKKLLQLLDVFKMGDTGLIIVERKKKQYE